MRSSHSGFTLIMGMYILVAITSLMTLMLSYNSQTLNQVSAIHTREQAQLLSRSATEYALLAISGHDRSGANGCINYINSSYSPNGSKDFDINTTIRYIGLNAVGGTCNDLPGASIIATPESNGTIIIDTYVSVNPANVPPGAATIRYHRRTIQKP
jgi:hypothetical protein